MLNYAWTNILPSLSWAYFYINLYLTLSFWRVSVHICIIGTALRAAIYFGIFADILWTFWLHFLVSILAPLYMGHDNCVFHQKHALDAGHYITLEIYIIYPLNSISLKALIYGVKCEMWVISWDFPADVIINKLKRAKIPVKYKISRVTWMILHTTKVIILMLLIINIFHHLSNGAMINKPPFNRIQLNCQCFACSTTQPTRLHRIAET